VTSLRDFFLLPVPNVCPPLVFSPAASTDPVYDTAAISVVFSTPACPVLTPIFGRFWTGGSFYAASFKIRSLRRLKTQVPTFSLSYPPNPTFFFPYLVPQAVQRKPRKENSFGIMFFFLATTLTNSLVIRTRCGKFTEGPSERPVS